MPYDENTPFDLLAIVEAMFGSELSDEVSARLGGGDKVYIPLKNDELSELTPILGAERMRLISAELGGLYLYVRMPSRPMKRLREVERLMKSGTAINVIARQLGVCSRTVYRLAASIKQRGAEGDAISSEEKGA